MFKSVCKALSIKKRQDQAESSDSSPSIPYVRPCPLDPLLDSSSVLKVLEDYKIVDYIFLDLGSCGQVYRIQTSKDKSVPLTCLKVIPAADSGHESCNSMLERAQNEVDIVRKLSHPHIIQLLHHRAYKSSLNPYVNAYFTMHFELCAKKLFTLITERQKARTLACRPLFERFFQQISSALAFIHAHHVVHHDLNGNNIMVVDDADPEGLHFKIIDFGCAHQYPEEAFSKTETDDEGDEPDSRQTSPSKATSRKRSQPNGYIPFYAEVYAFAIVALQVAVGLNRRPKQVEIRRAGRAAWMRAFQQEGRLRHVPERMQEVMLKVLEKCNENRVSMSDVVEFIQDQ